MSVHDISKSAEFVANLTEVGRFSLGAFVAVSLNQLFNDRFNRDFCIAFLKDILYNIKATEKVIESCITIYRSTEPVSVEPYVKELISSTNGIDILREVLIIALKQHEGYDARVKVCLKHMATALLISHNDLESLEDTIVAMVTEKTASAEEKEENANRAKQRDRRRLFMIGAAAVGGGALIGITGGLAAPLVAAGAGAIIGGGAAVIATTTGAAILASIFGAAGAGLTGYRMQRRVGSLTQFEFRSMNPESRHLSITLAICGFIKTNDDDFQNVWQNLYHSKEQYYLLWEPKYLLEMGKAIDYFLGFAKRMAIRKTLELTILSGLLAAIAWPTTLVSISHVIDNPYSVCSSRAEEAGKVLASLLIAREQGKRPVTLIGFSMGARVIYFCLMEMLERKKNDNANVEGIIEDVYIMGSPTTADSEEWASFERIIAGRIVNVYCTQDWLLRFLFRTATASINIAGLQPIAWENRRILNIDATSIVSGHSDYFTKINDILEFIGIRTRPTIVPKVAFSTSLPILSTTNTDIPIAGDDPVRSQSEKTLCLT